MVPLGRTEVPCTTERGLAVEEYSATGWPHGGGIEVIGPKEGFPGGRFGWVGGWMEQVECEFGLG